ncbi:amino acid ABC transporter substrate-binding protein [Kribbella lupini]|uniref:Branched-chain amino acid ABC transporter substrate-binding protein n=1 Tax=Kribbella lupini TaxID=291602 RepID=A0ABN2CP76_9ACTN
MSKRITAGAGALTFALVLAGCTSGSGANSGSGDSVIKIGVAISETGSYSAEGESVRHGYEYWEKRIDAAGGIDVDGKKQPVELVFYDDQSKPETAIKLVQRLISNDKVDFLFGPYSSGLTLATSAIAKQYKTIMFAGAGSASAIFKDGNEYVFSPLSITPQYARSALDLLSEQGVKTVAVLHTDEAPMVEADKATAAYGPEVGIKVVASQSLPADSTDARGAMGQLKAAGPDALLIFGTSVVGTLAVNTQRELNWNLPTAAIPAAGEGAFVKTLGAKKAVGILGASQWEDGAKFEDDFFGTAKEFAAGFQKEFGEGPTYLSASAAAAGYTLQLAVEAADSTDSAAVQDALYDLDVDTFFGHIDFADPGDKSGLVGANVERPMLAIQLNKTGRRTIIGPADAATDKYAPFVAWDKR